MASEEFTPRDTLLDELYKDLRRSQQNNLAFYHAPVPPSSSCPIAPSPSTAEAVPRLNFRHDLLTRLQAISHDFVCDRTDSQPTQDVRWHSILRILYIYALLNPAMGYIQGMNEVAFVLLYVFGHSGADITTRTETIHDEDPDMEAVLRSSEHAEADSFWCFSALFADIRDLYTFDGLDRAAAGLSGDEPTLHHGSGVLQTGNMAATLRSFSYRLHWIDLELWKTLVRLFPFCCSSSGASDSQLILIFTTACNPSRSPTSVFFVPMARVPT